MSKKENISMYEWTIPEFMLVYALINLSNAVNVMSRHWFMANPTGDRRMLFPLYDAISLIERAYEKSTMRLSASPLRNWLKKYETFLMHATLLWVVITRKVNKTRLLYSE